VARSCGFYEAGKELADAIKQLQALELPKPEKPGRADTSCETCMRWRCSWRARELAREESRGSHYRSDFPFRNDEDFGKHSAVQKGKDVRFET